MELGQQRCLAIIFCLYVYTRCSLQDSMPPYCKLSSLNQQFPGEHVPEKLRFMLYHRQSTSLPQHSKLLNGKSLCLDGNRTTLRVLPCNVEKISQKWFQLDSSLINIMYGYSVILNKTDSGVNVTVGLFESSHDPWTCRFDNNNKTFLVVASQLLNQTLYLKINSNVTILETTTEPTTSWGIADNAGMFLGSSDLLCNRREPFCGPPIPGIRSFVVSSQNDYSYYLHLNLSLLYKAFKTGSKTCYSGGDYILIGCPIGHVEIGTLDMTYKGISCLGNGLWSDPKPLHCRKHTCGRPRSYENSTLHVDEDFLYGDMVKYQCNDGFVGNDSIIICGPQGKWIGAPPYCKPICDYQILDARGFITSPNYPKPYPPAVRCVWRIKAPSGMRIALWFRDFFVEPGSLLPYACRFDVLSIKDRSRVDENSDIQFCGSSYPQHWFSNGSSLDIIFNTDSSYQAKGFKLEYTFWNSSITDRPIEPHRNGSFPEESEDTYVYKGSEYATYTVEGMYLVLVITIISFVVIMVVVHIVKSIKNRISPVAEAAARERLGARGRRNAVAECRATSMIDSMNKFSGLGNVSNVSVCRIPSMEALMEDINTFQVLAAQSDSKKTNTVTASLISLSSEDILPPTMVNDPWENDDIISVIGADAEEDTTHSNSPESFLGVPKSISLDSTKGKRMFEDEYPNLPRRSKEKSQNVITSAREEYNEEQESHEETRNEMRQGVTRQTLAIEEPVLPTLQRPSNVQNTSATLNVLFDSICDEDIGGNTTKLCEEIGTEDHGTSTTLEWKEFQKDTDATSSKDHSDTTPRTTEIKNVLSGQSESMIAAAGSEQAKGPSGGYLSLEKGNKNE